MDLLWRAGVTADKVVLGQGWYGRSFTLSSPSCNTPNGVCQFSGPADAGPCSNAAGILDYQEIQDVISKNNLNPTWDHIAGVKWITWNSNQWISYDDDDTFAQKRELANNRCLGGTMVSTILHGTHDISDLLHRSGQSIRKTSQQTPTSTASARATSKTLNRGLMTSALVSLATPPTVASSARKAPMQSLK